MTFISTLLSTFPTSTKKYFCPEDYATVVRDYHRTRSEAERSKDIPGDSVCHCAAEEVPLAHRVKDHVRVIDPITTLARMRL